MTSNSHIILFVSIDIIGSTAFKASKRSNEVGQQPWLSFFQSFYKSFPGEVARECSNNNLKKNPDVWKSLGDELIFIVDISNHREVAKYLNSFTDATSKVENDFKEKRINIGGLKLCAWLAGFPIINAEIKLENGRSDYLGPSVDAGFRIKHFSSKTRTAISPEVAYVIASENTIDNFEIYFEGEHILKGVTNEKPYPIFWIKRPDHVHDLTLKMSNRTATDYSDITKYCFNYFETINDPLIICKPYFPDDSDEHWRTPNNEHVKILRPMPNLDKSIERTPTDDPDRDKDPSETLIKMQHIKINPNDLGH